MARSLSFFSARVFVAAFFATVSAAPAVAQTTADPTTTAPSAAAQSADDDPGALDLAEPDFYVINVPTTLRLPVNKGSFHLTHRFGGNLRDPNSDFGDKAGNLFGLDQGAIIGFEYRHGIAPRLQAIVYRSSFEKTVQFSAKYDAIHQGGSTPVSISGLLSVEGVINFKERYAPALGLVVSREVQDRLAVYVAPIWVHNSAAAILQDRDTFMAGLGGRVRISTTVYITGEVSPRVAGYAPGDVEYGFAIEKRAGAHLFSLTFTNTFGTTPGQLARGGSPQTLYLGFNLARKFF